MAKFNLSEYDQVEDRIKKFYDENPDGRIITEVIYQDGERTMIKASIFESVEQQEKNCPRATGIAEEIRVMEVSVSSSGKEYEAVNFSAWTENCETSAIGRALANWKYSGNKRPSREEMDKVRRMNSNYRLGKKATNISSGKCSDCGADVSQKVVDFTKSKYGKVLCFDCQNKLKLTK